MAPSMRTLNLRPRRLAWPTTDETIQTHGRISLSELTSARTLKQDKHRMFKPNNQKRHVTGVTKTLEPSNDENKENNLSSVSYASSSGVVTRRQKQTLFLASFNEISPPIQKVIKKVPSIPSFALTPAEKAKRGTLLDITNSNQPISSLNLQTPPCKKQRSDTSFPSILRKSSRQRSSEGNSFCLSSASTHACEEEVSPRVEEFTYIDGFQEYSKRSKLFRVTVFKEDFLNIPPQFVNVITHVSSKQAG